MAHLHGEQKFTVSKSLHNPVILKKHEFATKKPLYHVGRVGGNTTFYFWCYRPEGEMLSEAFQANQNNVNFGCQGTFEFKSTSVYPGFTDPAQ